MAAGVKHTAQSLRETLENRSERIPESGCQIWLGAVDVWGYGIIHVRDKVLKTHRLSWEFHRGEIPAGLFVLHRCDIPCCISPNHLFLGTLVDNSQDCLKKGRNADTRGTKNGRAKLSVSDVLAIRTDCRPRKQIAAQYGISLALIQKIKHRDNWTHI